MHSQVSTTRRQFVLTILRQIQTPQEVVEKGKKKKKGKENSFGLVNKRFVLLPVWGKKQKKMYKRSSGKNPS